MCFKTIAPEDSRGPFPESRASVPGSPLKSGDSKWAEFFAERLIYNVQQTVHKLSGGSTLQHPWTTVFMYPYGFHSLQ